MSFVFSYPKTFTYNPNNATDFYIEELRDSGSAPEFLLGASQQPFYLEMVIASAFVQDTGAGNAYFGGCQVLDYRLDILDNAGNNIVPEQTRSASIFGKRSDQEAIFLNGIKRDPVFVPGGVSISLMNVRIPILSTAPIAPRVSSFIEFVGYVEK